MQNFDNLIGGEWRAGASYSPNLNPSNLSDVLGQYAQGSAADVEAATKPATIMKTIPKTRWWMCRPPGATFPGHQETSALIIRVLKRMKANESSIEPRRISPARWSAVSSALPLLM